MYDIYDIIWDVTYDEYKCMRIWWRIIQMKDEVDIRCKKVGCKQKVFFYDNTNPNFALDIL
jgi:DNA-directed RNA polymerase subunit RPC12/RpoP